MHLQECTSCSELKIPVTCKIRLQQLRRNADSIDVKKTMDKLWKIEDSWLEHPPIFDGLYQESGFSRAHLLVYRRAKG